MSTQKEEGKCNKQGSKFKGYLSSGQFFFFLHIMKHRVLWKFCPHKFLPSKVTHFKNWIILILKPFLRLWQNLKSKKVFIFQMRKKQLALDVEKLLPFEHLLIITAKWIWDRSIYYSIIKPSIDMKLFQYFWRFTQISEQFYYRNDNKNNFASKCCKFLANLCKVSKIVLQCNVMSNDGLIIENMYLSNIQLAVFLKFN